MRTTTVSTAGAEYSASQSPANDEISWAGTPFERTIGSWAAYALCALTVAYIIDFVVGFTALGNLSAPLPDPYLAVGEALILVMAPILVALMLALHACAPPRAKSFTLGALGWMLAERVPLPARSHRAADECARLACHRHLRLHRRVRNHLRPACPCVPAPPGRRGASPRL